jgi:hypothetical protein
MNPESTHTTGRKNEEMMLITENKSVTKLEWTGGLFDYGNRTHYFPAN